MKLLKTDLIHFEILPQHPMAWNAAWTVRLLLRVEKRFLWFKWIKSYSYTIPKEHEVIGQEIEWYLYGKEKKYTYNPLKAL